MPRANRDRARLALAWLSLALSLAACAPKPAGSRQADSSNPELRAYPLTPTNDVVERLHGVRVPDPYRWLEDDRSPAVGAWVAAQNRLTFEYLDRIPERPFIRARLAQLWNYERCGLPIRRGARLFYTRNDTSRSQSVLFWTDEGRAPRVLVDPNILSVDGTVALAGFSVGPDGRRVAYGLSVAGSDWQTWRVRDVDTGEDLSDTVSWVKFSNTAWARDGSGFFYSRYDQPGSEAARTALQQGHQLYFHRLGTAQAEDRLFYHRPDQPDWNLFAQVTEDGRYLVITALRGTDPRNALFCLDLSDPQARVVELPDAFAASFRFIASENAVFQVQSDLGAPRGRVLTLDLNQPAPRAWQELVPENTHTLESVTRAGRRLFLQYLSNAVSRVESVAIDGTEPRVVTLPGHGSVNGFEGRDDDPDTFFAFTSFTMPTAVYRHDLRSHLTEPWHVPRLAYDPAAYETRQVLYRSRDGTPIPMFLTHRKDLPLDGDRPTILYGYGGFRISLKPSFSVAQLVWMEMGGVYAVPNLRGGGEFGESWHQAAIARHKQRSFDDFIAAAEWLMLHQITNPRRLAIVGGSNGGLLVGACMTQRPGLFAAALPSVAVLDMLRFHRFTIGWAWTAEYGNPEDPAQFPALLAYSPLHNLEPGTVYPSTLVTTADHDDRVVPAHSFKFIAALQAAHAGSNPVLIRVDTRAGHGMGKPIDKLLEETADRWAFLVNELELQVPDFYFQPRQTEPVAPGSAQAPASAVP